MHELSTVRALCTKALEAAHAEGASRVTAIEIRIGALSHLSPSHLREHFTAAAGGSLLDGARLDIEVDTQADHEAAQEIELVRIEVE